MPIENRLLPILRQGIDMVRMIAFKRFRETVNVGNDTANNRLAGMLVNAIFDPEAATPPSPDISPAEHGLLKQHLIQAPHTLGELRIPVTDALRIQTLCDHQQGLDSTATLQQAMELGILMTERDLPLPHTFLHLVRTLGQAWGLLTPPSPHA